MCIYSQWRRRPGKVKTAAVWRAVCILYAGAVEETMKKTEKKKDTTHITRGASSVPATMNSAARLRLVDFHFY